jgi:hypothetical protein
MPKRTMHIATIHWRDPRWIDVQLHYLDRHAGGPYRTYACLGRLDGRWHSRFDYAIDHRGYIPDNLDHLAEVMTADAAPEDILVFMHGDTFPIAPLAPALERLLEAHPLVGTRRDENLGDPAPHACFTATTAGFWREIGGSWAHGPSYWIAPVDSVVREVGGELLRNLTARGVDWYPLLRTNTVDLHPLWFGVYGDLVYHHGAAFRRPLSRIDAAQARPRSRPFARYLDLRRRARESERLSAELFDEIARDELFYRRFL